MSGGTVTAVDRVRAVVRGTEDRRVRAIYRVVLAWPLLWFVTGTISVLVASRVVPGGMTKGANMAVFGLFQAAFFAAGWVGWARYLDRRPLREYGLDVSRSWILDLIAGFGAVLVGVAVWLGVTSSLGWSTVAVTATNPRGSLAFGLAGIFVGVILNVWVQETVFFGVVLTNTSEGLSSRGVDTTRAILGAWVVAVLIFTLKHRPAQLATALNLLIALGVFGILYVHTGELALSIGVHAGVNFAGNALLVSPSTATGPTILQVSSSLTGLLGSLHAGAIPQLLVAYCLLLVWIALRGDGEWIEEGLARWRVSTAE